MPNHDDTPVICLLAQRGHFCVSENRNSEKDRWRFICPLPGHHDTHPSFTVSANGQQWTCWACGQVLQGLRRLRELLGGPAITPLAKSAKPQKRERSKPEPLQGATLQALSVAKGLPLEHLKSLGWYDTYYFGVPAIAIPYTAGLRYRVAITAKDRFRWRKGGRLSLFGTEQIQEIRNAGRVLLVESETDVAAARLMGVPCLGVPGASTWKSDWAQVLEGLDVYAWQEPDVAGEEFVANIGADIDPLRVIDAPPGIKDLVELLNQCGSTEAAAEFLQELFEEESFYYAADDQPTTNGPALAGRQGLPFEDWAPIIGADYPKGTHFKPGKGRHEGTTVRETSKKKTLTVAPSPGATEEKRRRWAVARRRFPDVRGVHPYLIRVVCADHVGGEGFFAQTYANTWQNPTNAQNNRRKVLYNLLPKLGAPSTFVATPPTIGPNGCVTG